MKGLIKKIYNAIPAPIKNFQNSLRIKDRLLLIGKKNREQRTISAIKAKVRNGEKIHVLFMAMSVSFWKYDELFKLMQNSEAFEPLILLAPRPQDAVEIQEMHMQNLEKFFEKKGFPCSRNIEALNPDIIFYAQPYKNSLCENLRIYNFRDKLTCYVPYAFFISNYKWAYDALVHNLAWKLFYPSTLHKKNAEQIALNKGENVEVVGYPLADKFFLPALSDPWKIKDRTLKRIVWGVHHSIFSDDLVDCGTFLQNAEPMLARARASKAEQFAFKPHPHLKEHLYRHPEWGKERTDAYYAAWDEAPNTFLVDGDYIDLFKTSDALIHDCGSFTVEYLFIKKPVLYIGNERNAILCNFGKMAMEANYTLEDYDVDSFLQMVRGENTKTKNSSKEGDFKESVRLEAYEKYLLPPNGKTFAQNILDIISQDLCES